MEILLNFWPIGAGRVWSEADWLIFYEVSIDFLQYKNGSKIFYCLFRPSITIYTEGPQTFKKIVIALIYIYVFLEPVSYIKNLAFFESLQWKNLDECFSFPFLKFIMHWDVQQSFSIKLAKEKVEGNSISHQQWSIFVKYHSKRLIINAWYGMY